MPRGFTAFLRSALSFRSALAAGALAFAAAPAGLAAQAASGPVVSLHAGGVRLGSGYPGAVTAGVQVRGPGRTYLLGGVDAVVYRLGESDGFAAAPGTRVHVLELAPPRMRLGVGRRVGVGSLVASGEAYVGQQGVIDGFQPLGGAGVALGRDAWAFTVDGVVRRSDVYELTEQPSPGLPAPTVPRGRSWRPTLEVGARWDVGSLGRSALPRPGAPRTDRLERPIVGGILGGAAGAAAGMLVAIPVMQHCDGDEVCLLPVLAGGALGASAGIPVGVHKADGRRGNPYLGVLASLGIAGLGLAAVQYTGDSGVPPQSISVLVPIAQIAASTFIERRTARSR